jgi:mannose-6-phosphate isomerase-like protein (cupin superfamily)
MRKVNVNDIEEESWKSPRGKFAGASREVSVALGRDAKSLDLDKRHPFDVEVLRIPPGATPYPYHSHSAQWEFYHVISGSGVARDESGTTQIIAGDAFIYRPGEAHAFTNDGKSDLVMYVIADNPVGESVHYPDSEKWGVKSPERRLFRGAALDYFDGEE